MIFNMRTVFLLVGLRSMLAGCGVAFAETFDVKEHYSKTEQMGLIRIKRIVAQKVEVYWRKLCCTNRLRRAPSVVALASTLSPCL